MIGEYLKAKYASKGSNIHFLDSDNTTSTSYRDTYVQRDIPVGGAGEAAAEVKAQLRQSHFDLSQGTQGQPLQTSVFQQDFQCLNGAERPVPVDATALQRSHVLVGDSRSAFGSSSYAVTYKPGDFSQLDGPQDHSSRRGESAVRIGNTSSSLERSVMQQDYRTYSKAERAGAIQSSGDMMTELRKTHIIFDGRGDTQSEMQRQYVDRGAVARDPSADKGMRSKSNVPICNTRMPGVPFPFPQSETQAQFTHTKGERAPTIDQGKLRLVDILET
ncbi:hypothetical protein KIPB_001182 [Kipferlia bialata]|uniref:Uncharacterized protein n=1 Tax=Kipferlia bialata TaxID=797122 RepID=A0A9K3CRQ5_9EUKA|nr:hypothetical protein KIPB_001182 [Kipferlia bialata]|eukprot:g1182.t1